MQNAQDDQRERSIPSPKGYMVRVLNAVAGLVRTYPAVVAGLVIYGYYFFTTLFIFQKYEAETPGFFDYVFQYDSLLLLWLIAYIMIRSHQFKVQYMKEKTSSAVVLTEIERAQLASAILQRVVTQLEDRINNPLSVISSYTQQLRNTFSKDSDVVKKINHIDAMLQRIHNSIKDVAVYQTQSLLDNLQQSVKY
jgi:signal transduction histidine kinase